MPATAKARAVTRDALFDGHLYCCQHRPGYRFSVDALLVAHFSRPHSGARVLDLGSGSGIIGLIICYRWGRELAGLSCLELQPQLAELARTNVRDNGFSDLMTVTHGDLRRILDHFPAESFDQVVCNPPFYPLTNGRPSQNQEAFVARHQVHGGLTEIVAAAAAVCRHRGRVVMVYPAKELAGLLAILMAEHLTPKRLQLVYTSPGSTSEARLVLVEAVKNGGEGLSVLQPFYINERPGGPLTAEMQRLYETERV